MKKIQERLQAEREAKEKMKKEREQLALKHRNINREKIAKIVAQ